MWMWCKCERQACDSMKRVFSASFQETPGCRHLWHVTSQIHLHTTCKGPQPARVRALLAAGAPSGGLAGLQGSARAPAALRRGFLDGMHMPVPDTLPPVHGPAGPAPGANKRACGPAASRTRPGPGLPGMAEVTVRSALPRPAAPGVPKFKATSPYSACIRAAVVLGALWASAQLGRCTSADAHRLLGRPPAAPLPGAAPAPPAGCPPADHAGASERVAAPATAPLAPAGDGTCAHAPMPSASPLAARPAAASQCGASAPASPGSLSAAQPASDAGAAGVCAPAGLAQAPAALSPASAGGRGGAPSSASPAAAPAPPAGTGASAGARAAAAAARSTAGASAGGAARPPALSSFCSWGCRSLTCARACPTVIGIG